MNEKLTKKKGRSQDLYGRKNIGGGDQAGGLGGIVENRLGSKSDAQSAEFGWRLSFCESTESYPEHESMKRNLGGTLTALREKNKSNLGGGGS